jgi:uncharacterized protein YjiS (DUF1127 family)
MYIASHKSSGVVRFNPTEDVMSLSYLVSLVRSYFLYRASVRALASLNDRELADIGITRSEIRDVARQAVAA